MPELVPENQHPLNQRAKALLKEVKAKRELNGLYVYQLLQWSLDHDRHGLEERFRDQLSQAVFTLYGADPEVGMHILLKPPGEPRPNMVIEVNGFGRWCPFAAPLTGSGAGSGGRAP